MPENFDGQYEVSIIYDTVPSTFPLLEHTLTFDVLPVGTIPAGTDFSDIEIEQRNGLTQTLDLAVDAFVAGMIALYPATATIIRAELNYIPEGTYAKTFIATYPIDEVGTNGGSSQVAQQSTYTFRSIGGGSGRIQFMESSITGNSKSSYPYGSASLNAIPDLITAVTNFIIARDNTFMFANLHLSSGQNERLFRKRFRTS